MGWRAGSDSRANDGVRWEGGWDRDWREWEYCEPRSHGCRGRRTACGLDRGAWVRATDCSQSAATWGLSAWGGAWADDLVACRGGNVGSGLIRYSDVAGEIGRAS